MTGTRSSFHSPALFPSFWFAAVHLGNLVAIAKKKKRQLEELRKQKKSVVNDNSTHGEETSAKPPRENKQKPAQVIMTWMDTFQDNEKIQVSL